MTDFERVKEKLIGLRLKVMAQHLDAILKEATEKNRDLLFVLNQLADVEADRSLLKKLHYYQSPALLVCDLC